MPLLPSASDTRPRFGAPPSYRVQPPTPAGAKVGLTTPRARRTSGLATPPPASPLTSPPRESRTSTPRHAHKISTSSSLHSLRHSSSNGSLRGHQGSLPWSGSHSHAQHQGYTHAQGQRAHPHLAQGYSLSNHLPSPVTETNEVVDSAELRPSPPSSHFASSGDGEAEGDAGSGYSRFSDEEEYAYSEDGYDENMPCQFYGYAPTGSGTQASETLYSNSACGCCVPTSNNYDMILAPDLHPPYTSSYPEPLPERGMLTTLALRLFNHYVVPYLPPDVVAIIRDPPDLSRPQTFVPILRAVAPYTQYLILLAAMYIVYSFVVGMAGYFIRFLRFWFRIAPVIAIIATIMAASGQGGIDVVYEALKQYAGLAPTDGGAAGRAPNARGAGPRGPRQHYQNMHHANPHARTHRHRGRKQEQAPQPDILSGVFGNTANGQDGLAATVQDYVRQAVARGLGLEWLLGNEKKEEEPKGKKGARTR